MAKLNILGKDRYGVIKVRNEDIESFVNAQLSEFDKKFFKKNKPINIEEFAEFFLLKSINYCKLSEDSFVLGKTIIKEDVCVLYDDKGAYIERLSLGTICIDCKACDIYERERFTLAHELGIPNLI